MYAIKCKWFPKRLHGGYFFTHWRHPQQPVQNVLEKKKTVEWCAKKLNLHVQDSRCFKWVIALLVIIISAWDGVGTFAPKLLKMIDAARWMCARALAFLMNGCRPAAQRPRSRQCRVIRGCLAHFALKRDYTERKLFSAENLNMLVRGKSRAHNSERSAISGFNELPFRCFAHKTSVMRRW
jgi:hypothetical protein